MDGAASFACSLAPRRRTREGRRRRGAPGARLKSAPLSRPTAAGLAAVLLWSTTVAFSRTLGESLGPLTGGACVYLLGGAVSFAAAAAAKGGVRRIFAMPRAYLLGCGALFVGYTLLLYAAIGLAESRAAVVAVGLANYLWPPLLVLLSVPVLGRKARWSRLVPGVLLAVAGTALAAASASDVALADLLRGGGEPLPVLLAAAAAAMWALYSNLARRWGPSEGSGVPVFLVATGAAFAGLRVAAGEPAPSGWDAAPAVLYLALLPTWIAYRFWDEAMLRGDFALVSAASYFTPLLSTLVSVAVLGVPMTAPLAAAAALVTAGALLSRSGAD
jgi:drug/metabolite transporter (DMT)-like permease